MKNADVDAVSQSQGSDSMFVYILLVGILVLIGPNNKIKLNGIHEDNISKDNTDAVRGVFILLIMASHFANPLAPFSAPLDITYWKFRVFLGQLVVAMFLFYSGYGLLESIKRGGEGYVRQIPRNRLLKTILIYDLVQVCFVVINTIMGKKIPNLIPVLFAVKGIGSDNWYIFDILFCYFLTWLSFRLFPGEAKKAALLNTFLCLGFIAWLYARDYASNWYNTLLCYPLGQWYSIYRDKIEKACRNNIVYMIALISLAALFYLTYRHRKALVFYELHACLFALVLVLIGMKFTIGNPFLRWCGSNLISLFLMHRIPLRILQEKGWIDNMYLRFAVFWICSVLLAFLFSKIVGAINKSPLFAKKACKQG